MRHATLRQLKIFEAVARHLSFSRAAEELHLTQPAISMQVKQLESQVELPLFEQIGRKIYLTEAGLELQTRSNAILRELSEAQESIDALKGLTRGKLKVTAVSTAKYFVPGLLAQFLRNYPGVSLRLSVSNREELLQHLLDNESDLAIMGRPPMEMEAVAVPFARNPHVIVAAPTHPLARKKRIPLERLAAETFIMRERGSGTRSLVERLFSDNEVALNISMEMSSNETIKQAVLAEMGISFLSLHTIGLELETGRLAVLDVKGLPVVRDWNVMHRAGKRLSPIALAFKQFLIDKGGKMLPSK